MELVFLTLSFEKLNSTPFIYFVSYLLSCIFTMHECDDGMEVDGTSCEPANMIDRGESECADQHAVVAESVRGEGSSSSGPRPYSFAPVKACSGKYMALSTPTLSQGVYLPWLKKRRMRVMTVIVVVVVVVAAVQQHLSIPV